MLASKKPGLLIISYGECRSVRKPKAFGLAWRKAVITRANAVLARADALFFLS